LAHNAERHSTLGETLLHRLRRPLRRAERETFWALNDVSFDVHKGDVVGVIGRNGAGKSTLLKILSRIAEPTSGEIKLYGRIGSLLEVGTGFHPELTGRENIYLNGAILGMRRAEIQRHFDAIVDFSGCEKFLDTPVKRYSSGMYVRLAFAVAAHLESEIMVVDEVLAVGDAEFQKKCLGKMQDVAKSGRTVLFVSHNMQSVSLLCNKGIFLRGGRVTYTGPIQGAVDEYVKSFTSAAGSAADADRRRGSGEYRFAWAKPGKQLYRADEEKEITFRIERRRGHVGQMYLSAHVYDERGACVAHCDSRLVGQWVEDAEAVEGRFSFSNPWLKPGSYRVDLYACLAGIIDGYESACTLNISPVLPYDHPTSEDGVGYGVVLSDFQWSTHPAAPGGAAGNAPVAQSAAPAVTP
jgi:lipopolysaccharide transport system ATP-binding protein